MIIAIQMAVIISIFLIHNFMEQYYLEIAGVVFCVSTELQLPTSKAFSKFEVTRRNVDWNIIVVQRDELIKPKGEIIFKNDEYMICREMEPKMTRMYRDVLDVGKVYAVSHMNYTEKKVNICYLSEKKKYFNEWENTFFHVGIEQIMLLEQKIILHASFVKTIFGGILFSGTSGIGKSTQADLWCKYAGAMLLNGDRPIVGKEDGVWKAYGSPYAGSSKCYKKENCSVRIIVMLGQSETCNLRKLDKKEAFRKLYRQTTVNIWDAEFIEKMVAIESELVEEIPIYELNCTPDANAVQILWEILEVNT